MKILILTALLIVFAVSCDFFGNKNLLTFYYHAEDSTKKLMILKLLDDFETSTNIEVIAIEYFPDDINKLIINEDSLDIIEFENSVLYDIINSGIINKIDSKHEIKFTNKFDSINNIFPWISDYNLLFYNNQLSENLDKPFPVNSMDELISKCSKIDKEDKRALGMVINDKNNTLNNFLTFLKWNEVNLRITEDSIEFNNQLLIKSLEKYQRLSNYSFLGTKTEVEKEFLSGKITYLTGNSQLLNRINDSPNRQNFDYQLLRTPEGQIISEYYKSYLAISKYSGNLENSVRLINFLTADSTSNTIRKLMGLIDITTDIIDNNMTSVKTLEFNRLSFSHNSQSLSPKIVSEMEKALSLIILGQDSVYNVAEITHRKINKMIKQRKH